MNTSTILREHFPILRTREEVLADVLKDSHLQAVFYSWSIEQQEEFLDFCTGVRGVKTVYDTFFKEIINAEYAPERVNDLLSVLLKRKVKVLHILPNDSVRIGAESALLYTDLVVEFEDGSIANVEIQKIGYLFPGQRAACYSADLLLRQYKRIREERNERKEKFSYKDIKPVYTIVLFENSVDVFHKFPDEYMHYVEAKSDTGIEMDMLQKFLFIPLDIFKQKVKNKENISNKTEAWLRFFSMDEPEEILRLIAAYPEFKKMYEEVYRLCLNTEKVIEMFSEELRILDRNTVEYMVDVMQDKINEKSRLIEEQKELLESKQKEIYELKEKTQQTKIDTARKFLGIVDIPTIAERVGLSEEEVALLTAENE